MAAGKLFLETTTVPATTSLSEVSAVLVKAGAVSIETTYADGKPSGLRWSMKLYNNLVWFELPVKTEPVYKLFLKRNSGRRIRPNADRIRVMAERVAWRQLLTWVKVQMAMVELDQVEFAQIFLPYVQNPTTGASVWDMFKEQKFKALAAPTQ
jgi:hypothetical protein